MNFGFNRLMRHVLMLNRPSHYGIETKVIMLLLLHHPLTAQTESTATPLCDYSLRPKRSKCLIRILKFRKRLFLFPLARTDTHSPSLLMHVFPILALLPLVVSLLCRRIQVFIVHGSIPSIMLAWYFIQVTCGPLMNVCLTWRVCTRFWKYRLFHFIYE
jgi:hypothetical protein